MNQTVPSGLAAMPTGPALSVYNAYSTTTPIGDPPNTVALGWPVRGGCVSWVWDGNERKEHER
jgi:hypothetical protein